MVQQYDNETYKICPSCKKSIKWEAVVCPNCGVQVGNLKVEYQYPEHNYEYNPYMKSKGVAVVLAIFFSFWAWLYTYGKNSGKFWIVFIINSLRNVLLIYLISSSYNYSDYLSYIESISGGILTIIIISSIWNFAVWLWVLIYYAIKPRYFYFKYPYG